jgi:hypothetical protein
VPQGASRHAVDIDAGQAYAFSRFEITKMPDIVPLDLPGRRRFLRLSLASGGGVSVASFVAACGGGSDRIVPVWGAAQPPVPAPEPAPTPAPEPAPAPTEPPRPTSPFEAMSELQPADANGVMLPQGFSSRIVARSGEPPLPGRPAWHGAPDGGACFAAADGGWVYVSNSELALGADMKPAGGVGALRFSKDGELIDSYPILKNTGGNCAGGSTPWGTWLSCEEFELAPNDPLVALIGRSAGLVWECDPFTPWVDGQSGRSFPALGRFSHEAVSVDPFNRVLYLTEDASGGRIYRFVCDATDWPEGLDRPRLQNGKLQVLQLRGLPANAEVIAAAATAGLDIDKPCAVDWVDALHPEQGQGYVRLAVAPAEGVVPPGTFFPKCEGTWYFNGIVYFATQSNHRIWAFDVANQTIEVIYDGNKNAVDPVTFAVNRPDNITITALGEIIATEDGGNLEIGIVRADRSAQVIARLVGHDASETTGPALSPDGTRLYFSSQRGTTGKAEDGITFEIALPRPAR